MIIALFLLTAGLTDPAQEPHSHAACIALAETDATAAQDYAEAWITFGGGRPARHCKALVELALDRPTRAAEILEDLAAEEAADKSIAARLHLKAAEAHMAADRPRRSFAQIEAAYHAAPDHPEIHMVAATIFATAKNWRRTIDALDALEAFAPLSADAFALRARAAVETDQHRAAAADVARALALEPLLVDALVLKGELAALGVAIPNTSAADGP